MFYGIINESYDKCDYLEMELENSLLFFKSLDVVQESGIQIVQESFSDIVGKIKELWNRFKEWVKGIIEKIKNFFSKFKKKSESNTEEKIIQSLQNPQVAPKGSDGISDEEAEKAAKKIKDNWDKIEKLEKENDKELDNLQDTKKNAANNINERHKEAQEIIKDALKNIYDVKISDENEKISNQIERDLNNLSKDDKSMSVEDVKEIIKKRVPSTPNNSKILYIEDEGDDYWKNTEYMDFSEGCKKIVQKRELGMFEYLNRFPYYYYAIDSTEIGRRRAFNAEDTVKIDKEVEDFFNRYFGAFYNASDDEIVTKQKPKESDVQKFAKNLGDILIMTREYVRIGNKLPEIIQKKIDMYQVHLDKFMKKAPIVNRFMYEEEKKKYYNDRSNKIPNPSETMLVRRGNSDSDYNIDTSVIAKFIAKDIDNMKKCISLISKVNTNCVKVYNYNINLAKAKMFSDQIRRLEDETAYAPDKLMAAY